MKTCSCVLFAIFLIMKERLKPDNTVDIHVAKFQTKVITKQMWSCLRDILHASSITLHKRPTLSHQEQMNGL